MTIDTLRITPATQPDVEAIAGLLRTQAVPTYEAAGDPAFNQLVSNYFEHKIDILPDELLAGVRRYWIASRGGNVVGMYGYNPAHKPSGLFHSVYVDAAERGQGVGSALMRHALASPEVTYPCSALIAETNTPAIDFYAKLGFILSGGQVPWSLSNERIIPSVEMVLERQPA